MLIKVPKISHNMEGSERARNQIQPESRSMMVLFWCSGYLLMHNKATPKVSKVNQQLFYHGHDSMGKEFGWAP